MKVRENKTSYLYHIYYSRVRAQYVQQSKRAPIFWALFSIPKGQILPEKMQPKIHLFSFRVTKTTRFSCICLFLPWKLGLEHSLLSQETVFLVECDLANFEVLFLRNKIFHRVYVFMSSDIILGRWWSDDLLGLRQAVKYFISLGVC